MKNTKEFIAQAKHGDNRWWKYILSILSIIAGLFIGQIPITIFSYYKKESLGITDEEFLEYQNTMNYEALGIVDNTFLFLLLSTFVFMFIAFVWLFPRIHKRPLLSFITARSKFDWNRFLFGLGIWFVLAIVVVFLILDPSHYTYNFQWRKFVPLLIISLFMVPIQSSIEELFFRGYLMQGIHRLVRKKVVTLVIVTLLFALAHVFNPEFKSGIVPIAASFLIFSLFMTCIAMLDNGLELSMGIHTGNNLFVTVILSSTGASITTPSLFITDIKHLVEVLPYLLSILSIISFVILKMRYKWKWRL